MARPYKDPEIQRKIKEWVEKNPSRWWTAKYEDIRVAADVSLSSLYRYLPLIMARAAEMLPSEVKAKREEEGGSRPWRRKLSDAEITEVQRLCEAGHESLDIADMTGKSLSQIEKIKRGSRGGKKEE